MPSKSMQAFAAAGAVAAALIAHSGAEAAEVGGKCYPVDEIKQIMKDEGQIRIAGGQPDSKRSDGKFEPAKARHFYLNPQTGTSYSVIGDRPYTESSDCLQIDARFENGYIPAQNGVLDQRVLQPTTGNVRAICGKIDDRLCREHNKTILEDTRSGMLMAFQATVKQAWNESIFKPGQTVTLELYGPQRVGLIGVSTQGVMNTIEGLNGSGFSPKGYDLAIQKPVADNLKAGGINPG